MKATPAKPFDVICPDCGAILKVDPETRGVLSHTPAPRKRTFEDFEAAAKAMREQDERKEDIFRQSVEAEKNKQQLFDKRFDEAFLRIYNRVARERERAMGITHIPQQVASTVQDAAEGLKYQGNRLLDQGWDKNWVRTVAAGTLVP